MCGRVGGRSGRSSGACQATAEKTSSELAAGLQTRRRRHFTACLKEAALRHPSSKEQVLICNITSGSLGLNVGRFTLNHLPMKLLAHYPQAGSVVVPYDDVTCFRVLGDIRGFATIILNPNDAARGARWRSNHLHCALEEGFTLIKIPVSFNAGQCQYR
jgi:hypothetical protein